MSCVCPHHRTTCGPQRQSTATSSTLLITKKWDAARRGPRPESTRRTAAVLSARRSAYGGKRLPLWLLLLSDLSLDVCRLGPRRCIHYVGIGRDTRYHHGYGRWLLLWPVGRRDDLVAFNLARRRLFKAKRGVRARSWAGGSQTQTGFCQLASDGKGGLEKRRTRSSKR